MIENGIITNGSELQIEAQNHEGVMRLLYQAVVDEYNRRYEASLEPELFGEEETKFRASQAELFSIAKRMEKHFLTESHLDRIEEINNG